MAKTNFAAKLSDWAKETEKRMQAVFRQSAQTVANEVRKPKGKGGHLPVDTGNLRRSLIASTVEMPTTSAQAEFPDKTENIKLTIAGMKLGETVYLGFQAAYARRQEYGFQGEDALGRTYHQAGNGFVRLTAQRWGSIVEETARKLKSKVESRDQ